MFGFAWRIGLASDLLILFLRSLSAGHADSLPALPWGCSSHIYKGETIDEKMVFEEAIGGDAGWGQEIQKAGSILRGCGGRIESDHTLRAAVVDPGDR